MIGSPRQSPRIALTLALITACTGVQPLLAQDDADATRQQLEQLEAEIARISTARDTRRARRDQEQQQLADSERRLGELRQALASLNARIAARDRDIAALEVRSEALRDALEQQSETVARELRRAYRSADGDQLKLLLSQQDPQTFARMLAYYRYILDARSELLEAYRADLEELSRTDDALVASRQALQDERSAVRTQEQEIERERAQRSELLAQINAALANDEALLAQREQDRASLEQLLSEIEAATASLAIPMETQPFSAAQGQMPWPVDGRITDRFGGPRNQGKMRWQGVRLQADAGSPVSAIHHGRVVYADWLRGAGLLLVIDHGEGYMSLYAHNETLLREVGDWVSTGAAVATVGSSGGQERPGLYFEVRKDGKPRNPQRWCRS